MAVWPRWADEVRHWINSPIKTDKCLKYLMGSALITGSVRQRGQLVGDLLYCCMTKATFAEGDHYPPPAAVEKGDSRGVCEQEAAEGDHYPPVPAVERGTHAGFANKRSPRATVIRESRQWRAETHGGFPKKKLARGTIIRDSRH